MDVDFALIASITGLAASVIPFLTKILSAWRNQTSVKLEIQGLEIDVNQENFDHEQLAEIITQLKGHIEDEKHAVVPSKFNINGE